jgi:hypothetical protein
LLIYYNFKYETGLRLGEAEGSQKAEQHYKDQNSFTGQGTLYREERVDRNDRTPARERSSEDGGDTWQLPGHDFAADSHC